MQTDNNNDKIKNNYKKKYRLNPKLTNKYCASVYNPTVQPDEKTEMGVPVPSVQNTDFSKEYEEENEL
ncbi:hypothetical protein [uncultured Eubacterium sp.]|uniref:hypothetical protein n=1 Tax=uncultured Eubacterium sp. TaxID=165185 RepID=UPI0025D64009|nr:hypothetical protein [uncultured Eubacterium sp.]